MTTIRTKQQTACDGVRVVWVGDTFTNILQRQVETQFSMDGVIPLHKIDVTPKLQKINKIAPAPSYFPERRKIARTLDGIRLPWKEAYAA
jgi:hypothetical protein